MPALSSTQKVRDFPGGGLFFFGGGSAFKFAWWTQIIWRETCSTNYLGIDTYLSCWKIMSYPPSRELFRTYPAIIREPEKNLPKRRGYLSSREGSSKSSYKVLKRRQLKVQIGRKKKHHSTIPPGKSMAITKKHRLPSKCMRPLDLWTPAPPPRIHRIQRANRFQVTEWPRTSSPPWFGKYPNIYLSLPPGS